MALGRIAKWALLLGAGTAFAATALMFVLVFYRTQIFIIVQNKTTAPISIARLAYGGTVFRENLTLAPGEGSAPFCRAQSYWNTLTVEISWPREVTPVLSSFRLEQHFYVPPLFVVEIHDGQVTVEDIGRADYFMDTSKFCQ